MAHCHSVNKADFALGWVLSSCQTLHFTAGMLRAQLTPKSKGLPYIMPIVCYNT